MSNVGQESFPEPHLKDRLPDLLRSHSPTSSQPSFHYLPHLGRAREIRRYKIAELEAELSRLKSHRSALEVYRRDCRSLLAPIRRLPSETLVDIFQLCRPSEVEFSRSSNGIDTAMAYLAQESMLWIAQVCVLWHSIVLDTPSLWNNIFLHKAALRGTPQQCETTMELLRLAFERSGSLPLNFRFESFEGDPTRYGPALELIASQSARWQTVRILCNSHFRYLSAAKGNLPVLTTLELNTSWGIALEELDFLQFAPSVKHLTIYGSIESCVRGLPLEGLVTYQCAPWRLNEIASVVSSMSRLSYPCAVTATLQFDSWNQHQGLQIAQTSSNIGSLCLKVSRFRPAYCLLGFEQIFAALTLPSLRDLSFTADGNSLSWPHDQFIGLAIRSSFHDHLYRLDLSHFHIKPPELVECLSTLPALQELSIADRFPKPLITNGLLKALTRTPEDSTCLVPHLQVFECISHLRFDDNVFLSLLVSRCESDDSTGSPFTSRICCSMDYYRRPIDSEVAARIRDMCAQGDLTFEWL
ncbi:F-box domain-containing protein [Mycena sanguinolenta]|uniref:F-box domain-containing protein n=1 Tax=Mycena sanguinolenta TaxID=230812 RepID=A0A8H7D4L6_9AGAR|nr:F-box domain-containing protein [Mycena sanguinolenta]